MTDSKTQTQTQTQEERDLLVDEIRLFIDYGIEREEKAAALETLKSYSENGVALSVLRDFYARLPKFREEAVKEVFKIVSRMGFYLLGVNTKSFEYLYFFDGNKSFYLGEKKDGIQESEVLSFFGYSSNDQFQKEISGGHRQDTETVLEVKVFCPACSVESGELHQLGCPVEICPWCEGQLTYCNCRFEKLGVEEIEDERDVDRLEILLNHKGRIPFSSEQAPAYPEEGGASEGS